MPPEGHRAFTLPEGLGDLESPDGGPKHGPLHLINAERKGLIWSQLLDTGEMAVLKMYRHRGAVDWWREKQFRFRVQREFDSLTRLDRAGIPCSAPLFWTHDVSDSYGRYEILATREIPDATPLPDYLRSLGSNLSDATLLPVFSMIAEMHEEGLHHGALYPRNILVTDVDKVEFHIIDVPKAIVFPRSITGTRMADIDLLNLCHELAAVCNLPVSVALLLHYGMDEQPARRFAERVKTYRPTKHTRNRHLAECKLRGLVANRVTAPRL